MATTEDPATVAACRACGSFTCPGRYPGDACERFPVASDDPIRPSHYGGTDNPYEAIKVIEAWDLNFSLGNAVKYVARAGKKGDDVEDLRKAAQYLQFEIARRERERGA